jgi:hypothetical protein
MAPFPFAYIDSLGQHFNKSWSAGMEHAKIARFSDCYWGQLKKRKFTDAERAYR